MNWNPNDFERELIALAVIFILMVNFDYGFIAGLAILIYLAANSPLFQGAK